MIPYLHSKIAVMNSYRTIGWELYPDPRVQVGCDTGQPVEDQLQDINIYYVRPT